MSIGRAIRTAIARPQWSAQWSAQLYAFRSAFIESIWGALGESFCAAVRRAVWVS